MAVYTEEGDVAVQKLGIPAKKALTDTASCSTLEMSATWLRECKLQHECGSFALIPQQPLASGKGAPEAPGIAPGRLVDLREFSGSRSHARIVDTTDILEGGEGGVLYTTLSYCWGQIDFYRTIRANLQSNQKLLPYESLPRTFQDAFNITKNHGVDFLWIDALCIVQDSSDDWNIESAKMPYIYSQAYFCIAADSSATANGGCYNRAGATTNPVAITATLSDNSRSTLFLFETAHEVDDAPMAIERGPIARRGWTYQERVLSPRILHYTSQQLFWECRERYAAEDGTTTWRTEPSKTVASLVDYASRRPERLIEAWYDKLVSTSTARKLTMKKDKLPAIAGLARLYHRSLASQYVAGIWTWRIELGLSWRRAASVRPAPKVRQNSFSWISVDGPVVFHSDAFETIGLIKLISFDVQLKSPLDPFGDVGACSLTLSGKLREAELCPKCEDRPDGQWDLAVALPDSGTMVSGGVNMDVEVEETHFFYLPISHNNFGYQGLVLACLSPEDGQLRRFCRLGSVLIQHTCNMEWLWDCPEEKFLLV